MLNIRINEMYAQGIVAALFYAGIDHCLLG